MKMLLPTHKLLPQPPLGKWDEDSIC